MNEKIDKMLNTNEINRLQRAAKNKDKKEIIKWADEFEQTVHNKYYEIYKKEYMNWLNETFLDLDIAICHALHFNENLKFGNKRLADFMRDLSENVRGFYKKTYSRDDYKKQLEDDGVKFEESNWFIGSKK